MSRNSRGSFNLLKSSAEISQSETSRINPVPAYRAYGVTKRENFFTVLNEILAIILGWYLYIPCFFIILVGTIFMIKLLGNTGVIFAFLVIILFIYFVLGRNIRKRASFVSKLRKKCKQLGYAFEFKRSFFRGLRFNNEGIDLIVHSPYKRWYLRFMTPKKHRSYITILNRNEIEVKTNVTRNHLKAVLGFGKIKVRRYDYSFKEVFNSDSIKTQKVLLINPVPLDMFKKDIDGATIPIGSGEKLYDYVMFSGSGFISDLQREYDESKKR